MKNRTSSIIIGVLIILAALGIFNSISSNPINFLKGVAVLFIMSVVIYFIVRKLSNSSPQRKEQRAFLKAAKKSKRRLQKSGVSQAKNSSQGTLTTLKKNIKTKKKPPAHLTVIEGKKSKKKNRASL